MAAHDFPIEWVSARISDISVKCEQRTPEKIEEFVYVDIGSIDRELKKIATPQTLLGHEAPSRARKVINKGDVLVSLTRPNLNAVALVPDQLNGQIASTGFEVIKPIGVDSRYIFNITRSHHFIDSISGAVQGALYPAAKSSDVQNYKIPLSSAAEQKEIADRLDILLAQVEATQARLARIPDIIKQFRQSVLAAAVSGKLTEEWRELNNRIEQWKPIELKEAAEIIDPHPSHRTPKAVDGGVPYIGIGDLRLDGSIDFENARKVSFDVLKEHNERYTLKAGDFIFGKIGTLGKATILPIGIDYTLSANVILIQPIEHIATPEYLQFFLSSPSTLDEIAKQANSTSQAAFGIKKMRTFQCKLPNKEEQNEIVRRVEQLFAYADSIEQQAKAAKERVDNLTQAILAKAFRGELTADWRVANPHLISGDNSAAALLARIQAERAANGGKKKKRTLKQ
ncbi:restriction endonuclease subunit S [Aeromonas veronii]